MFACITSPDCGNALLELGQEFSPRVEAVAPDAVVLDLAGLERLIGTPTEIARKIAGKPRLAIAMTKASVNIELKDAVRSAMDAYIAYECATQQHPDHLKAVRAFMETKPPRTNERPRNRQL